jgi:hypothetical protein
MKPLVFYWLGEQNRDSFRFSIYHNRSCLSSGNIELEGGHLGLIAVKRVYIGALVGSGMGNMTKSSIV